MRRCFPLRCVTFIVCCCIWLMDHSSPNLHYTCSIPQLFSGLLCQATSFEFSAQVLALTCFAREVAPNVKVIGRYDKHEEHFGEEQSGHSSSYPFTAAVFPPCFLSITRPHICRWLPSSFARTGSFELSLPRRKTLPLFRPLKLCRSAALPGKRLRASSLLSRHSCTL